VGPRRGERVREVGLRLGDKRIVLGDKRIVLGDKRIVHGDKRIVHGDKRIVLGESGTALGESGRLYVYLARVIGRVVTTQRYEGLEGVPLQWIRPLDENGEAMGEALVACAVVSTGPGDLVHFVDGREAALACPETFVPVDAAIIGYVEEAVSGGKHLERLATEART